MSTEFYGGRLDSLSNLKAWGFDENTCTRCGISNSELSGSLFQCAKCKKAYYCSMKCFNADLMTHAKICNTGKIDEKQKMLSVSKHSTTSSNDISTSSFADAKSCSDGEEEDWRVDDDHEEVGEKDSIADETKDATTDENGIAIEPESDDEGETPLELEIKAAEEAERGKEMFVFEVEEIHDEEDEEEVTHPFFLYMDEEEIEEETMVLWLVRDGEGENCFTVVQCDEDEEIEIVRGRKGTAVIEEDEDETDRAADEPDTYLTMDLPNVPRPEPEQVKQEAVQLYGLDGSQEEKRKNLPSWISRSPLRSVGAANSNKRPEPKVPSWLSSRVLKNRKTKNEAKDKKSPSAAALWDAMKNGHADMRLYRRTVSGEGGQGDAGYDPKVPSSIKQGSVMFTRVPLRPIGPRPESMSIFDYDASSRFSEDGSSRSMRMSFGDNLRSTTPSVRHSFNDAQVPSWASKSHLKSTGRRASLLTGSDHNSMRRMPSVNQNIFWKHKLSSSEHATSSSSSSSRRASGGGGR